MNNVEKRYHFAHDLITKAGELALEYYQNRHGLQIECKAGEKLDEVSIADETVEAFIQREIKRHFPNDGFLGEESGAFSLEKDFCWIIDPIDGTSPFLHGLHAWCVSISLLHQNEIVAGLIFDPLHGELFHGVAGGGAYLNGQWIFTQQNAVSIADGLTGLGISHRVKPEKFIPFINIILQEKGIFVRNGSGALTLAQVAAGRLIAYFEPHMNIWDSSAGVLLVKEAGGAVSSILKNDGLRKGNYVLVAATSELYQKLNAIYQML